MVRLNLRLDVLIDFRQFLYRRPAFFAAEGITEIAEANHQIHLLRQDHNEQEIHREIGMVPQNAWQKAMR